MIFHSLSRWKFQVEGSERETEKCEKWNRAMTLNLLFFEPLRMYIHALQHLNIVWFNHLEFAQYHPHLNIWMYWRRIKSKKQRIYIAWALIRCSIPFQGYYLANLPNESMIIIYFLLFHLTSASIYFALLSTFVHSVSPIHFHRWAYETSFKITATQNNHSILWNKNKALNNNVNIIYVHKWYANQHILRQLSIINYNNNNTKVKSKCI